jgi:hypothetical protein
MTQGSPEPGRSGALALVPPVRSDVMAVLA